MLISELAAATNKTAPTLRFYETAGVLPEPPRTRGRYRDYPETAIGRVRLIRSLQSADLTLDEIATVIHILDNITPPRSTDVALVEATMARIDAHLDTLCRMRRELVTLVTEAATRTPPRCARRTPDQSYRINT